MIRVQPQHERVAHQLLGIGGEPPVPAPGASERLRDRVVGAVQSAAREVPDGRQVVVTKRTVTALAQCEQLFVTEREQPWPDPIPDRFAVGLIVHAAVVIAHYCPDQHPEHYASEAVSSLRRSRRDFAAWLAQADQGSFADAMTTATNAVATFIQDWPALDPRWRPAWESTLRVQYGPVVFHARPDLVLGAPRANEAPTMVLCDWKVGQLWDDHRQESMVYAAISALRHGVPPARSFAYSLLTGAWTHPPTVTADDLQGAADLLADAAVRLVELDHQGRPPARAAGKWCQRCPLREGCSEREEYESSAGSAPEQSASPLEAA